MNRTILFAAATLFSLTALPVNATAQTVSRSGHYSLNMGNEWAGGSFFAGAALQATRTLRSTTSVETNDYAFNALNTDGSVRILRQSPITLFAGSLSSRGQNYGTSPYAASFQLYVRGIVELNQRFTTTGIHTFLSYYRTFDLFPTDPSIGISVYGVPVTVRGNAGVGVEARLGSNLPGGGYASLNGFARGWGYGRVHAQAGWSHFGAGADFNITFANTRLSAGTFADARRLSTTSRTGGELIVRAPSAGGSVALTFQSITLRIDVWVAFIGRLTSNLVNYASNPISILNVLF